MSDKLTEILLESFSINRKRAFRGSSLMKYFDCNDQSEFISKFVEPTKIELTKYGEAYENHIQTISVRDNTEYVFSELAAMLMGYVFAQSPNPLQNAGFELQCMMGDAKHYNSSFFVSLKDPNVPLRIGDKVQILSTSPSVLGPKTPMINYKGKIGRIREKFDNGCFGVIVDCVGHEVCFKPELLERKID